ncbi:MAG: putative LPS assembly protein LptD [Saprospiraceae bacterium]
MKRIIYIIMFSLSVATLWAQQPTQEMINSAIGETVIQDTLPSETRRSETLREQIGQDSIPPLDTLGGNANPFGNQRLGGQPDFAAIEMSKDSLDKPLTYSARDSMIYDIKNKTIYLFGNASIEYDDIVMTAGYVEFDYGNNMVTAEAARDAAGRKFGIPEFKQGEQQFTAGKLRFNFKNKKGIIYDVTTQQSDLFIRGGKSKFVGATETDTTSQNVIYSSDAIFTTCNHPQPHYGIRSRKQKVVPDKVVVVGPSNIELAGIPTPLWLPFGFFPLNTPGQQRHGLIFPRDFEYSDQWGYGIRNLGYYFPINEYYDLSVTGDIYLKGTWGLNVSTQFRKRYKYNGNVAVGYARRRTEDGLGNISFNPSFFLRTTLNQDNRAHPAIRIGGNVNIQGNNFQNVNQNDAQSVLQNQLSSNLSFTHTFPGKPYNLSIGLNHSQNTRTREVRISLPNVNFQVQTFQPFKIFKDKDNPEKKWYENINMTYRGEIQNRFVTTDTTFFSQETLDAMQVGARHRAEMNTSFKVLKYFNLNPSVRYEETWHFKSQELTFDPAAVISVDTTEDATGEPIVTRDTIGFGSLDTLSQWGFNPVRQFTTSLSLNTQLFGTLRFKGDKLKGIRHVLKPSFSFNYTPNYVNPSPEFAGYAADYSPAQNDYFGYIPTTTQDTLLKRYSLYDGNIYSGPPTSGKQMSIGYSFTNIFEAKYWSKKDSTDKKLKLFDNVYVRGNYNFARDTLRFSETSVSGTTRLFKGLSTLTLNAAFDPYSGVKNSTGTALTRINRFYFEDTGKILRFVDASLRLGTTIRISEIKRRIEQARTRRDEREGNQTDPDDLTLDKGADVGGILPEERPQPRGAERRPATDSEEANQDPNALNDGLLDLFDRFTFSHNLVLNLERLPSGKDTLTIQTNSLSMNGNLQLTPKWSVRVGNFGYDFKNKRLTYPDFGVSRNLHCWQLSFNFQPVRNTYSMTLQVAPGSSLDFLKIPYQRNNQDGQRFGGF